MVRSRRCSAARVVLAGSKIRRGDKPKCGGGLVVAVGTVSKAKVRLSKYSEVRVGP